MDAMDVNMNITTVTIGVIINATAEADQTHQNPVCVIILEIDVKIRAEYEAIVEIPKQNPIGPYVRFPSPSIPFRQTVSTLSKIQ